MEDRGWKIEDGRRIYLGLVWMDVDDDGECEKNEVDGMVRGSMNDGTKKKKETKRRKKKNDPHHCWVTKKRKI